MPGPLTAASAVEVATAEMAAARAGAPHRIALPGTSLTIMPPLGFAELDSLGLISTADAVRIVARAEISTWPSWQFILDTLGPNRTKDYIDAMGIVGDATSELIESDSLRYVLIGGEGRAQGSRIWIAVFDTDPMTSLYVFVQHADDSEFSSRDAVGRLLSTASIQTPRAVGDEFIGLGLAVRPRWPFDGVVPARGRLGFVGWKGPEEGEARPSLSLRADRRDMETSFMTARSLEDLARNALTREAAPVVHEVREISFCGVTGLRMSAQPCDYRLKGQHEGVAYASMVGGVPVILVGLGSEAAMTTELISTIDTIAASVRRQNESDWASAPGE